MATAEPERRRPSGPGRDGIRVTGKARASGCSRPLQGRQVEANS